MFRNNDKQESDKTEPRDIGTHLNCLHVKVLTNVWSRKKSKQTLFLMSIQILNETKIVILVLQ